ncbi:hypothetical protein GLOIN_2v1844569 [Rhizophagus irregularis DAOM 181602=DAOM 197198]|uniref:Uncharacterized protein n=1 Tax=Rhizophagus irregularis (strain DAOM 181602 / DAOM 197198 / MUCL 43194) TaxID=747089 RepID=A0A2P4PK40_RHIID|nr:hypothetical protein GLOIN_2v1844569 [Rhizophagus irregularis DAOM 181602=DAOM 197198]POG65738.1 hypothetical protein GLOIN_2v1844569 [Rhizophagus irregularis DAOM 181602=DAOM 197198]|eukprot:XP_025172604.1 hypothetical protein GLOIN_2v1844569 [Rhizophagus irregularis DAOM 181602=DAOM 197198]
MEDSLQGVLRDFYNKLNKTEKLLLYTCITDLAGYTFLLMSFLILSGKFLINFVVILLIFFPIISGITMFYSKTILHGIAFICVHSFPIIMGVSIFYTQDNVCSDIPKDCIFPKGSIYYISAVLLLSFLLIVTAFYCLILYHLWARKLWPLRHEYPYTKREDIIVRYEPTPDEFKVENTLKKRESTSADFDL